MGESASTVAREAEAHDALVLLVDDALDEPGRRGPVDQLHGAVVAQQQVVGHLTDGRITRMAPYREQELVVRRRETGAARLFLAPPGEAPKAVPHREQALVVGFG